MAYVVAVAVLIVGAGLAFFGSKRDHPLAFIVGLLVAVSALMAVIVIGAPRAQSAAEIACAARGGSSTTIRGETVCFAVGAVLRQPEPVKPR